MKRALFFALLLVALVGEVAAQHPAQAPAWDVTLKTNTLADSTLTVVNRCQKNHRFQIQLTNLPFLHFSSTQVNVKGGATQLVPVKFDTGNLALGVYQGTVLVICQSCKGEAACMQDREVLQVVLRVTSETPVTGPPGATTTNPPSSPPATGQPPTNQPAALGPGVRDIMLSPAPDAIAEALANALKKKELLDKEVEKLRADVAAAQEAADKARQAVETAEQDARNAKAQAEAARKAVTDAGKAVDQASDAVAAAEAELVAANRTTAEREAARAALEKAKADLAAAKKALEDARANAADVNRQKGQKAADEAAKAREKKAEVDKAAAALAAAQKALAEKEKELLKAEQEVAAAQAAKDKAEQEAREREAAKAAAAKAAQEKLWAEDIERRRQVEKDRADRAVEIEYLLDNIQKLGLITYKPKTKVPDPLDHVFNETLRKLIGQTASDFLQTVAGEIGGGPIPGNVVGALTELAKSLGSFFDVRTKAGKDEALDKLQGMINPNVQPPRKYTMDEALAKMGKMEELMRELQKKLAAAQAAAGK